ncbi:MAG: hypothetical protein LBB40_01915, partial [Holophagales bacterium]|nr:hypothetical protein [Holophagales bacterium]
MLSNRKSRISALLSLLLLPLALLAGLIACKPSKLSNSTVPNVPKAETPIALSPGILAFINGTWEGTLGDPLGWSMRFDCFAQDGIQKVLLSVISKDFQTFYLPVNYNIEGDGLQLWWNDENNRGTVKLRFGWGRQVVATVSQLQRGTASGTFTKTSDTPKDGAVSYHGAWEGTLGDPLGWSVRFDCFAQSGIQRVLASITSDEWNAHFFPVNHALESDGLQLWWNDEANRQKIKLQFNQNGQLVGELFNRQGQQKAAGVFSRTSATPTAGEFHVKPQDNFIRHLRNYSGFDRSDAGPVVFEYDYSHPKLAELKEKYNLT